MAPQDPLQSQEESKLEISEESSPVFKMEPEFEEEDLTFGVEGGDPSENQSPFYFGHAVFDADIKMEYQFDHHESPNTPTNDGDSDVVFVPPPFSAPPSFACIVEGCEWTPNNEATLHRLRGHFIRAHLQNSPYACPVPSCGFSATTLSQFEMHLNRHLLFLKNKRICWSCESCGGTFSKRALLWRHSCLQKQNRPSIKLCSMDEIIGYLKMHYSNLESNGILTTTTTTSGQEELFSTCGGDFLGIIKQMKKRIDMEAILKRDSVFIRTWEGNPGWEEQVLLKRTQNKQKHGRVQCPHCEKSFKSKRNYEIHKSKMHTPYPFQCPTCRRDFRKEHFLKTHLKSFDCVREAPYMRRLESLRWACTKCGLELLSPIRMKTHWLQAHQFRIPTTNRRRRRKCEDVELELEKDHGREMDMRHLLLPMVKVESEPPVDIKMIIPSDYVWEMETGREEPNLIVPDNLESPQIQISKDEEMVKHEIEDDVID